MNEETITIPMKEYKALQASDMMLLALESAGVDNWVGYGEAMEMLDDLLEESDK